MARSIWKGDDVLLKSRTNPFTKVDPLGDFWSVKQSLRLNEL